MKETNVQAFLGDLDGGNFEHKIAAILSEVAAATVTHGRQGEIHLAFKMKQIGTQHQVQIDHSIKYKKATLHGARQEEASFITPMHVGDGGSLSFFPEKQGQLFNHTSKAEQDA